MYVCKNHPRPYNRKNSVKAENRTQNRQNE